MAHSPAVIRSDWLCTRRRRGLRRLAGDPHVLLALAVVLAALFIEMVSRGNAIAVLAPSLVYLGGQALLGLWARRHRSAELDIARLISRLRPSSG